MKELSTSEQNALRDCEKTIEKGINSFREVGESLMKIRDEKLHRATHKTFEAYCKERWSFGKSRAYQLIDAATVAENVHNCGQKPDKESQARPLAALPESEQPAAWSEAVESADGKQPTAKQVKEVVEKRAKPEPGPLDGLLASVRDAIEQAEAFRELMNAITQVKSKVRKIIESPLGRHINPQELNAHLTNAFRILKFAMPFADCVYCGRTIKKTCKACGGQGWLVQDVFNQAPADMKANSVVRKAER